jgi:hypothetical protein
VEGISYSPEEIAGAFKDGAFWYETEWWHQGVPLFLENPEDVQALLQLLEAAGTPWAETMHRVITSTLHLTPPPPPGDQDP